MNIPDEIIAIPWRTKEDGSGIMPIPELGFQDIVWFDDNPDPSSGSRLIPVARTDAEGNLLEGSLPERIGTLSIDGTVLILRVGFFRPDGTECDPTGETGGHTERWVRVPTVSESGRDYSDDELEAELDRVLERHCDSIRDAIAEQVEAIKARETRTELVRKGLIDREDDRPQKKKHDQRRRILSRRPLTKKIRRKA